MRGIMEPSFRCVDMRTEAISNGQVAGSLSLAPMSSAFFALAIISGVVALGGFAWSVAKDLRTRRQETLTAEEVRALSDTGSNHGSVIGGSTIVPVENEIPSSPSAFSFAGLGDRLRRQGLRATLPGLLVAVGFLAVLVFGALALLASLPSKLFGLAALGVAVYVSATELRSFAKALRGQDR
jgi:hypothetical protein